ncbi:MAG TPA: ParB/RepB/Spo0J family partition protein [Nitrososphaerales archaeon]|nr:ParB/RepB/Spo0J family partition protein [Nitrososphaerales archaeon]
MSVLKAIKISDLVDMPLTIRSNPQVSPKFTQNIKDNGILSPPIVRPRSNGKFEIVYGHRRIVGAREAGLDYIDCLVRTNLGDREAYKLALSENMYLPPNPMDLSDFLLKFQAEYDLTQRETAIDAGLTEEQLCNLFRVHRDEVLRDLVRNGDLDLHPALDLLTLRSKLPEKMTMEEWRSFVNERSLRKTLDIRRLAHSLNTQKPLSLDEKCFCCGGTEDLKNKKVRLCRKHYGGPDSSKTGSSSN